MAGERKLTVVLAGDSRGLDNALGRATKSAGGFGSKLGGLTKTAGLAFAGLATGAVVLGKGFVDAAVESQKVSKQTEAVIKSMGGASGVTADQVAALSEKMSMQSGVDDEVIQSAQNVLLTFGKVQNKVGDGNKIFDRASQSALDMSVALGTDMQGASIQVGKALNDPIKGITALGRAGVSFSQKQKDTIKKLVESGDTLGAQKIILGELDKQFGGSAAAQATAGERLQVVWGNLQEKLGEKLLPIIEKVASFLANNLPKAFDALGKVLGPIAAKVSEFWYTFTSGFTKDEGTDIERFALKVREVIGQVAAAVQQWAPRVIAGFQVIVAFVRQHWPEIQRIVVQVVQTIQTIVAGVVQTVTVLWQNFGNNILSFVQRVWPPIQQLISGVMTAIRGVIQVVTSLIKGDWSAAWDGVKKIFTGVWSAIQGAVKTAFEGLRLVIGAALEVVGSMVKGAWNGIVDFFKGIPGRLASAGSGMFDFIKTAFKAAVNWVIDKWNGFRLTLGPIKVEGPFGLGSATIGPYHLDTPDIPRLAAGGIVKHRPGGILANIGEGRYDEAVVPLNGRGLGLQPVPVVIELDGQVLGRAMIRFDADHRAVNGRSAFGA